MPNSLWPWTVAHQFSPRDFSDSCPLSPWCYLTISTSVPLISFCPQSFPASRSFLMSHFFASGALSVLTHVIFFYLDCFLWSLDGNFRVIYQYSAELPLTQTIKMVKNLPPMQETQVWSLCQEDPLEKRMSSHSSILSCRIPQTVHGGGWGRVTKNLTKQWL